MNVRCFALVLLLASFATGAAQNATPAAAPAAVRRAPTLPIRSAEIAEDRRVTFRLRAPKAAEVAVTGAFANGRTAMTKGTNDVWSVTLGPVEPGIWEYSFNVDGVSMIDPGNPAIKPMREPRSSILHVTGATPLVWDFQDVAHGTVHLHTYRSKALGRVRELAIYTPPGYDQNAAAKFPTLYLQHGSGDSHATWVTHGKAHWIFDNLIAQRRMTPMVVVMMDGHASTGGGNNTELFEQDLLQDVMPFVEASYRVKAAAASRAIVGLSMGGGQSLTIGLNHTEKFAWVGGFSSSVPSKDTVASALSDAATTNGGRASYSGDVASKRLIQLRESYEKPARSLPEEAIPAR